MIYNMKLQKEPFKMIKDGTKTIELRLNDEKRRLLKVGDEIVFTSIENLEQMKVEIENLYKYSTFEELYKHFDKVSIGYKDDEVASPKDMEKYYSKEEQEKYGVVGIKIKKITD